MRPAPALLLVLASCAAPMSLPPPKPDVVAERPRWEDEYRRIMAYPRGGSTASYAGLPPLGDLAPLPSSTVCQVIGATVICQ